MEKNALRMLRMVSLNTGPNTSQYQLTSVLYLILSIFVDQFYLFFTILFPYITMVLVLKSNETSYLQLITVIFLL